MNVVMFAYLVDALIARNTGRVRSSFTAEQKWQMDEMMMQYHGIGATPERAAEVIAKEVLS